MVYKNIKINYDKKTNIYLKKYRGFSRKSIKLKISKKFLIRCRKARIIPNFIMNATKHLEKIFLVNNRIPPKILQTLNKITHTYHIKVLSLLIKLKHKLIADNERNVQSTWSKLQQQLTSTDKALLLQCENKLNENLINKTTERHKKKYTNLRAEQEDAFKLNTEWFINKTNTTIPENIQWLLSRGPKFALPMTKKQMPVLQYIADIEDCIQTLPNNESKEKARSKFTRTIDLYQRKPQNTVTDKHVLSTVEQTKQFLKQNPNILILNADKGNKTVAMEKSDYENRMNNILGDMMTYRRLNKDPTSKMENKNNNLVAELFGKKIISEYEKRMMTTKTAITPRIYGLPKIHKEGTPLRPICSSVNSPAYKLCKYMANILKNLTKNSKYNTKNAVEFKHRVNDTPINADEVLVSFDVVSLFPSIPVDLAIEVISRRWNEVAEHTNIPKELFTRILTFTTKENRFFEYKGKIYTQLKGMPMGSPLSPILADIVMEELLDKSMELVEHKPRLLTKYVDDLFGIIKNDEVQNTLEALNKFHRNIKFTVEMENNGQLPYLDSMVIKKEGKVKINWYQKPTASGRIINYKSKHPRNMIINTASNFVRRVLTTSDPIFHGENKKKIIEILGKNDFPEATSRGLINKFYNTQNNRERNNTNNNPQRKYKSVTYIPELTDAFRKSNLYNKEQYNIAANIKYTTQRFFSTTKSKLQDGVLKKPRIPQYFQIIR